MKDITFEASLIAATPKLKNSSFVKNTMAKIKATSKQRTGFVFWLSHLHKPVLALLALLVTALIGGVVYAAINFAPALIELLNKQTNTGGRTEYSVAGFEACAAGTGLATTDKFEVSKDAPPLSDEEVKKILQAKCELQWIGGFTRQNWPTYGTHAEWQDGDEIYYTRTDTLGKVISLSENSARIEAWQGSESILNTLPGEKVKAYFGGKEVPLDQIKPGDFAFTIVRVTETYYDWNIHKNDNPYPDKSMHVLGLVGIFKMSLPKEYYFEKQGYITEVPTCIGNESEYCPNTGYIDVYPRNFGEGSFNPYAGPIGEDSIFRQISGVVTRLEAGSLTLRSRAGNEYTVAVGDNGFATYNNTYAKDYDTIDAVLRVGSTVDVRYSQHKGDDPKVITKEQVQDVSLQLEATNPKEGGVKQY